MKSEKRTKKLSRKSEEKVKWEIGKKSEVGNRKKVKSEVRKKK